MILYNKTSHFASRQFLTERSDTSSRSVLIQNKMIETPGAKIRQHSWKSNRPASLSSCHLYLRHVTSLQNGREKLSTRLQPQKRAPFILFYFISFHFISLVSVKVSPSLGNEPIGVRTIYTQWVGKWNNFQRRPNKGPAYPLLITFSNCWLSLIQLSIRR